MIYLLNCNWVATL